MRGGGTSVFYLQVYFESNSLSRIYRIEISQAHTYQVNFYFKDEVIKNIKVEENKTVSAPDFSREGYTITGWKVNNETVSFPLTISENTDIYADYSLVNYNLNLNLNDGHIDFSKTTYTIEDETFTLPIPTKQGYKFIGWSGTDIEGMTLDVTIEKGSTGDRSYTANWQIKTFTVNIPENQDVYTLTYNNLTVEYGGDFVFKVDLTDAYSQSTIVVKANGEEIQKDGEYYTISNITQNINVTIEGATINTYIIRWLNHDGSVLETDENVEYGTMPTYDGTTPTKPESASLTHIPSAVGIAKLNLQLPIKIIQRSLAKQSKHLR